MRISAFGPTSKFIEKSDHLQEISSYKADERYTEEVMVSNKMVYTRMYFTSESHIHGILNVLRYGYSSNGLRAVTEDGMRALDEVPEYDYLSHILLRLFENDMYDINDPRRFRVELSFSPGCTIVNIMLLYSYRTWRVMRILCVNPELFFTTALLVSIYRVFHNSTRLAKYSQPCFK